MRQFGGGGETPFFLKKHIPCSESNKSVLKHHNNVIRMKSLLWNMFSYDYYHSFEERILVSVSNPTPLSNEINESETRLPKGLRRESVTLEPGRKPKARCERLPA